MSKKNIVSKTQERWNNLNPSDTVVHVNLAIGAEKGTRLLEVVAVYPLFHDNAGQRRFFLARDWSEAGKLKEFYEFFTMKEFTKKFGYTINVNEKEKDAETGEVLAEKGRYLGRCNRTACDSLAPARFYNHSTERHYCAVCADLINRANPEFHKENGHDLCTISIDSETDFAEENIEDKISQG